MSSLKAPSASAVSGAISRTPHDRVFADLRASGKPWSLGIMQPYFFPYLGYFDLIHRADRWIVFDVVPYRKKRWMNRNRILRPDRGWQHVSVPVTRGTTGLIRDTVLTDRPAARDRVLGQLDHYRRDAPFYRQVAGLVEHAFAGEDDSLTNLNVRGLAAVCDYLGLPFHYAICSEIELDLPPILHPGQWALEIAARLGATQYLNAPGGREIFRASEFAAREIELRFTEVVPFRYGCGERPFVEHLSILDVLMWNTPSQVLERLSRCPAVS